MQLIKKKNVIFQNAVNTSNRMKQKVMRFFKQNRFMNLFRQGLCES